jgi:hypothetical protein
MFLMFGEMYQFHNFQLRTFHQAGASEYVKGNGKVAPLQAQRGPEGG